MNKEDFLKAIMELPKVTANNPISAMNGINVDDLMNAIDRLNKVPDYNDLLKENKRQKEVIDKAIEYIEKFIPIDEDTILLREKQRDYLLDILNEVSK